MKSLVKASLRLLAVSILLAGVIPALAQTVSWSGAGDAVSWNDPTNWSGNQVPGATNDVVISGGVGTTVVISSGNIMVESLQCTKGLAISSGSLAVTSGTSLLQGSLTMGNGTFLSASGSNTTFSCSGSGIFDHASAYVSGGAELVLPGLQSYDGRGYCSNPYFQASGAGSRLVLTNLTSLAGNTCGYLHVEALAGGRVELGGVTNFPDSSIQFLADGTGSLVDLNGLVAYNGSSYGSYMEARNGGEVRVPQLVQATEMNFTLGVNGLIGLASVTNLTKGSLTVGASNVVVLPALTSANSASLYVSGGAELVLPGLQSYDGRGYCSNPYFQASGAGSRLVLTNLTSLAGNTCGYLHVEALAGGRVELGGVTNFPDSSIQFLADGTGSLVDLNGLVAYNGSSYGSYMEARNGGEVRVPQLVQATEMNFTLGVNGLIGLASVTNLTKGSLTVGASNVVVLPALTSANSASLYVSGGAELVLPGLQSYDGRGYCSNPYFQASGAGSRLVLTNLTSLAGNTCGYLHVEALAGGRVELGGVTNFPDSSIQFLADGTGSLVDLNGLVAYNGSSYGSYMEARNGGEVRVPQLVQATEMNFTLGVNGLIGLASVTNLTKGSLTVGASNVVVLPALTSANSASLYVSGGAELVLPGLQSYDGRGYCSNPYFQASGAGSRLVLTNLTSLAGNTCGYLHVEALVGGRIELGAVQVISEGYVTIVADGDGSVVDLQGLSGFVMSGQGSLEARNSGTILFGEGPFLLANVSINIPGNIIPPSATLILYGKAWHSYWVEKRDTRSTENPWVYAARVPLTNAFQPFAPALPSDTAFRVAEFVANPPILDLWQMPSQQVQLVFYGATNVSFSVETTNTLNAHPASWETWAQTGVMTNSFRIFPAFPAAEGKRFYRGKQL